MMKSLKEYIPLSLHWDDEGEESYDGVIIPFLSPSCLHLEAGGRFTVDGFRKDGLLPSFLSGGYGERYTLRASCDNEDNYDKVYYIYFEQFGKVGRWRCGDKYVPVDVLWDEHGEIRPTCIYMGDFAYSIPRGGILRKYRMSTRKTDGSGLRFIVRASCPQLQDMNREFSLMLEDGGKFIGRWFVEDADVVHRRRVLFSETDSQAFDKQDVDECMGVTHVCARYQVTIDMTEILREWNNKNSAWLSPEEFEKRIDRGDIRPTDYAPVFVAGEDGIETQIMRWGLRRSWTTAPLYNARAETLLEKDTYQGITDNRCIVPCGGFFENEHEGKKIIGRYLFTKQDSTTLYMAGIYEHTTEGDKYTVLTTEADFSVDIHDRMPVVLDLRESKAWLRGLIGPDSVAGQKKVPLRKERIG